jgi:hypothetical protein
MRAIGKGRRSSTRKVAVRNVRHIAPLRVCSHAGMGAERTPRSNLVVRPPRASPTVLCSYWNHGLWGQGGAMTVAAAPN